MAEGIRIEVRDEAVRSALSRLEGPLLADAMQAIGASLVASTQRRFERQQGPDGKPWARLKARTAAQRVRGSRRGFDNILRVTNRLQQSIVYAASAESVEVGTNVAYAAIHQLGGTIQREARRQTVYQRYNEKTGDITGFVKRSRSNLARDVDVAAHEIKIPARPYLGLDDADRVEILAIVEDVIKAAAGGQR